MYLFQLSEPHWIQLLCQEKKRVGIKGAEFTEKLWLKSGNDPQHFGKTMYIINQKLLNTDNCANFMHKSLGLFFATCFWPVSLNPLQAAISKMNREGMEHDFIV